MLSIVLLIFYFLMFQFQIMSDTIDFSSLVCNICGVQCKSNTSLRKHIKGVHDDRQFSFQFRLRLRKHINSHSKRKCNICGYKAKTESKLTHHLEKKHVPAIKPVKVFYCEFCPFSSARKWNVFQHQKMHNSENTIPDSFQHLFVMFCNLEKVAAIMHNRQETINFTKLKTAVEQMTRKCFTISDMKKIKTVYKEAHQIIWSKDMGDFELTMNSNEKLGPKQLSKRKNNFLNYLHQHCKDGACSIKESVIPSPTSAKKPVTAAQVLDKLFTCEKSKPAPLRKSLASALEGVPQNLIKTVLVKEGQRKSNLLNIEKRRAIDKTNQLKELARNIKSVFVIEKKQALSLQFLTAKVSASMASCITHEVILQHIKELVEKCNTWISIVKIRGVEYVKLDLNMNTNLVLTKLS